jgi:hypothetical protein
MPVVDNPIVRRRPSQTLSARDFAECEICGAPALPHPRFEVRVSNFNERPSVRCCACSHEELEMPIAQDRQMWACTDCGLARQWGNGSPADRFFRALLGCDRCGRLTVHAFKVRLV